MAQKLLVKEWPVLSSKRWLRNTWATNMPVVSKAQARFMGAIASGSIKKKGLSRAKAKEFLLGVKVSKLPARIKKKKK